jgi:prepilin-type N-terminal cleavage/methylation domain-containing protein
VIPARLWQLRHSREERGYSLVELLTVIVILGVVMEGLTTLFVTASNAQVDMNNRFQAQQTARVALDKVRREVHCASGAGSTPANQQVSLVTLALPTYCKTYSGSATVTWCTRSVSSNRYALYRINAGSATCTGGVKWADYLAPSSTAPVCSGALCVFDYRTATATLARLHVDFPVNVRPSKTVERYELTNDLVLRNSVRP